MKLLENLAATKQQPLRRALVVLSTRHADPTVTRALASRSGSTSEIRVASVDRLTNTEGVGSVIAQSSELWLKVGWHAGIAETWTTVGVRMADELPGPGNDD